jgi:hypothetical protein
MEYSVTEQYARSEEKFIAKFSDLNAATIFIAQKSSNDNIESRKLIYRLYNESELLQEINKENISVAYAQYAEGSHTFNGRLPFLVMIKANNALERKPIANFIDIKDAELFIVGKCDADYTIGDNDLFFIFREQNLMDTLNKVILANRKKKSEGTRGNESGSTFQPTPLSRRPTPSGGPSDCWVEKEKDDDENQQ